MPSWLPFAFIALACPIGMGLAMWFMMRMMRGERAQPRGASQDTESSEERLARLEAEKKALEQQISRTRAGGDTTRQPRF